MTGIQIFSRDTCCQGRIANIEIRVGDIDPNGVTTLGTPITVNSVYATYAGPPGTSGQQVQRRAWQGCVLLHARSPSSLFNPAFLLPLVCRS